MDVGVKTRSFLPGAAFGRFVSSSFSSIFFEGWCLEAVARKRRCRHLVGMVSGSYDQLGNQSNPSADAKKKTGGCRILEAPMTWCLHVTLELFHKGVARGSQACALLENFAIYIG